MLLTHLGANLDDWDPRIVDGRVDVFGLSMGGMVARAVAAHAPGLTDRLILVGSGPADGSGLADMTRVTVPTTIRASATFNDPKALLLFFTALARHLPAATVTVFPNSGHGVAFQNHRAFVDAARDFLRR